MNNVNNQGVIAMYFGNISLTEGCPDITFEDAPPVTESFSADKFDENWDTKTCLLWIQSQMTPGILYKHPVWSAENDLHLIPMCVEDNTPCMKANQCTYSTSGNKSRSIHGNRLYYADKNGTLIDSGICRMQRPFKLKQFFSYHLRKTIEEKKSQHIFNLVTSEEQIQRGYVEYYVDLSTNDDIPEKTLKGKKTRITVATTRTNVRIPVVDHTLEVKKFNGSDGDNEADPLSKADVYVTNFDSWPDGNGILLHELDTLAGEVINAKKDKTVNIHCRAGKGRTGTLSAATILKETIERGDNILGINSGNCKYVVCKLIVSLRNNGGGDMFVHTETQLSTLFRYAERLIDVNKI